MFISNVHCFFSSMFRCIDLQCSVFLSLSCLLYLNIFLICFNFILHFSSDGQLKHFFLSFNRFALRFKKCIGGMVQDYDVLECFALINQNLRIGTKMALIA